MIEVTVSRLGLDSASNSYVVVLQEKGGLRFLPIWIGQPEAESIALHLNNVPRERPITHDLCKSLILGLGGIVRRIQITRVLHGTFYAELHLQRGDHVVTIDARPSDSIAIALRLGAPIFALESLLTYPTDVDDFPAAERETPADDQSAQQLKEFLQNLRPEDFGKFSM